MCKDIRVRIPNNSMDGSPPLRLITDPVLKPSLYDLCPPPEATSWLAAYTILHFETTAECKYLKYLSNKSLKNIHQPNSPTNITTTCQFGTETQAGRH